MNHALSRSQPRAHIAARGAPSAVGSEGSPPDRAVAPRAARRVVRRAASHVWLAAVVALVATMGFARPAAAQWRNFGVQIPNAGWLALGNTTDALNDQINNKRWNATDQFTIGAGFFAAVGYNLWSDSQIAIGIGSVNVSQLPQPEPVFSVSVSTGLRFNFLDEKVRPFVSGHIHLLTLINPLLADIPTNAILGSVPTWIGPRLGGGVELFFVEEQSIQLEVGAIALLGFADGGIVRPSALGRLSWNVYF